VRLCSRVVRRISPAVHGARRDLALDDESARNDRRRDRHDQHVGAGQSHLEPHERGLSYTIGGYYEDTLARVDGHWLLTGVRLTVTRRADDPGIMELARDEGTRRLAG
jgi:hypothetical protein